MTEPVKRYNLRQNMPATATTFLPDVVVSATDYARLEQECERFKAANTDLQIHFDAVKADYDAALKQVEGLRNLINTPHTDEWFEAVRLEAAHQIERWGSDHDAGKAPADWFWLLGYLGQKAMTAQMAGDDEKARHHTVSSGAMLLNWFRSMVGDSSAMRPGIDAALQAKPCATTK